MKKRMLKRSLLLMLSALTVTSFSGGNVNAADLETTYLSSDELQNKSSEAPKPDEVLPDANQYKYQKDELAAFCHFGPNTFNEIEWGEHYGDKTPDEIFKLEEDFDAETLVKGLKDAGFKKLIVTAKHHDGFCIWNSEFTEYDVANTSYKDGKGDILAEISAACTKYNLDMGLYLSPWDIHEESYGYYDKDGNPCDKDQDYLDYNEHYNDQLQEILSSDKYGNAGHFVEVWMDGAKGSGQDAQDYEFQTWFNTIQTYEGKKAGYEADCMLFGAEAYTTVRWIGNEKGYADKNTWSKSNVNYEQNTIDSNRQGSYTVGFEDGNKWTVPEADTPITSGWFWGETKKTPKDMEALANMYFGSVGHNAPLLLNVPPNNKGSVDKDILTAVSKFGKNIQNTFKTNLVKSVKASSVWNEDATFGPSQVMDGKDDTYWASANGSKEGSLLIDLGEEKTFDIVSIEEAIQKGQHINSYKVEYRLGDAGEWKVMEEGETIGAKRLCRDSAIKADQIRITVGTKEGKVPMLSEVGVYKASDDFSIVDDTPEGIDVIDITDKRFTPDRNWISEEGPNYLGGTNKYANTGASLELKFTGTKAYLLGTLDPNHGKADIYIDGKKVETIDTSASKRATGQRIFESPDLEDGDHTLKL